MLEVELKVKIPSLDPVREQLRREGAEFLSKVHEHDIFYNAPHRDFAITDEAVRVRYTNGNTVVSYKGPKIKKYGLKAREELNFSVESGETFETMLLRLGFSKTAEVNKWRENYTFKKASISLDTVDGLGTFAEIEVIIEDDTENPTAQIEKIATEIGVEGEPILASYLEMLLAKKTGERR
jgi:adenylate cyclase, class 2